MADKSRSHAAPGEVALLKRALPMAAGEELGGQEPGKRRKVGDLNAVVLIGSQGAGKENDGERR